MKKIIGVIAVIIVIALIITGGKIVETVDYGSYHIKQAIVSGEMSVQSDPGLYFQNFGDIRTYQQADVFYFSNDNLDGGDGAETQPLNCTFQGNSTADVSGVIKYRLAVSDNQRLELQKEYGSDQAIKMQLVRNAVADAIKHTGPMFTPEEAFITRRSEFSEIVKGMIRDGIYKTKTTVDKVERDGKIIKVQTTHLVRDENGKPVVNESSTFKDFGLTITQFNIKTFDFDTKTDELIQKKKDAEQTQVVSRAKAEKAKQDAITAKAQGDADIATAKAQEEVSKIRAITKAQKEKEVAELDAEKKYQVAKFNKKASLEDAQRKVNLGKAEAEVARLKVKAGLTPLEKATIDKDTRIGVAREIGKITLPKIMMGGGSNGSGGMDAINVKFMMDIMNGINKK